MRSLILAAALGALTVANPVPQEINIDIIEAAPDPTYSEAIGLAAQTVTYNIAALVAQATSVTSVTVQSVPAASNQATATLERRDGNCATQPAGATGAPTYSPDTPSAFAANTAFAVAASAAPTPAGYDQTFVNLNASNNAYGYMGFATLQNYDSQACASQCDAINGCLAVNLYFERDPSLDPGAACPDPASVTMIKCVFWGGPVTADNAVNYGQPRDNFTVFIAGSNGYVNQSLEVPAGYTDIAYLGNAAINAPYDSQGYNTYMGSIIFSDGPFNASLCADHCTAQTEYNVAHPPSNGAPVQTCQFFNTYIVYINSSSDVQGQYCAIYSEAWDSSYATNTGQYRGSDDYLIEYSYTFTNESGMISPNKEGAIYQASVDITYATLQTYCSTILGYSTPLATVTSTTTITPLTTTSATVYQTALITSTTTPAPQRKRQDESSSTDLVSEVGLNFTTTFATADFSDHTLPTEAPVPTTDSTNATVEKRDISTPAVLSKYPATVVSSACELIIPAATSWSTSTIVVNATATASTSTITATINATTTQITIVTASPSSSSTSSSSSSSSSSLSSSSTSSSSTPSSSTPSSSTPSSSTPSSSTSSSSIPSSSKYTSSTSVPATSSTSSSTSSSSSTLSTSTRISSTSTSSSSTPAPTCASNSVFTDTADLCKCSYTQSCGALPLTSCFLPFGYQTSYQNCMRVCDTFFNCYGANYYTNGLCVICPLPISSKVTGGDGTAGVVAGMRNSKSCKTGYCLD